MHWIKKNIPNLFTLANLSLGVLAIHELTSNNSSDAPIVHYYIFLAAFFDLFDGLLARKLKVESSFGVQLDSLADLITFGIAPTFIYAKYVGFEGWGLLLLLVPICSAIRLAIFNTSSDQKTSFKGISTTAHGLFAATVPVIVYSDSGFLANAVSANNLWVVVIAVFFSALMVAPIHMISLKFQGFSFTRNWPKYALILISIGLIAVLGFESAPWVLILYLLMSAVDAFVNNLDKRALD